METVTRVGDPALLWRGEDLRGRTLEVIGVWVRTSGAVGASHCSCVSGGTQGGQMTKSRIRMPDGSLVEADERPGAVDLPTGALQHRDGSPYTEADAVADAAEVLDTLGRGKPSLSGRGTSPQIGVRLPAELRRQLAARARDEGRGESEIVRDALRSYLAS